MRVYTKKTSKGTWFSLTPHCEIRGCFNRNLSHAPHARICNYCHDQRRSFCQICADDGTLQREYEADQKKRTAHRLPHKYTPKPEAPAFGSICRVCHRSEDYELHEMPQRRLI